MEIMKMEINDLQLQFPNEQSAALLCLGPSPPFPLSYPKWRGNLVTIMGAEPSLPLSSTPSP